MAVLVNELSWSRSRLSTLENCRRQYYYHYYQKWGGWSWDADDEQRRAYFFSKMKDLPLLLGTAVHDTIKEMLEQIRDDGATRIEDPGLHARKMLARTWRNAEHKRYRQSLKNHPPIFELYYGPQPPREHLKAVGAKAAACLQRFTSSELYAELEQERGRGWLAVDEGPSFDDESQQVRVDGIKVWALPDFARERSGICEIWDWKTGGASAHDANQLASYALFARDVWGFAPDKIRLMAFYLGSGEIRDYGCDAGKLASVEARIRRDFETMQSLLADPAANRPLPADDAFPLIEDLATCRRCHFKELCGRAGAEEIAAAS